jgi:hypothetical protein
MKNSLVADGRARLLSSEGHQSRLRAFRNAIEAKYADELEQAGPLQRFVIRHRMADEFRREKQKIEPSKYALYSRKPSLSLPGQ